MPRFEYTVVGFFPARDGEWVLESRGLFFFLFCLFCFFNKLQNRGQKTNEKKKKKSLIPKGKVYLTGSIPPSSIGSRQ